MNTQNPHVQALNKVLSSTLVLAPRACKPAIAIQGNQCGTIPRCNAALGYPIEIVTSFLIFEESVRRAFEFFFIIAYGLQLLVLPSPIMQAMQAVQLLTAQLVAEREQHGRQRQALQQEVRA